MGRPLPHMKPLTEEEKKNELIRIADQKRKAITEGVIFNLIHASGGEVDSDKVVDYAIAVGDTYVAKVYGVTFTKVEQNENEKEVAEK